MKFEVISNLEVENSSLPDEFFEKNLEFRRYYILLMFVLL